jgi:hypothetical protein
MSSKASSRKGKERATDHEGTGEEGATNDPAGPSRSIKTVATSERESSDGEEEDDDEDEEEEEP